LRLELILLDSSINIHPSQHQVHRRGAEIAKGYFLLIQPREARGWIKSLFPSGLKSKSFDVYGTYQEPRPGRTEAFLFGGISPPNRKTSSLRPRRLGGENFILDKHETELIPFIREVWSAKSEVQCLNCRFKYLDASVIF